MRSEYLEIISHESQGGLDQIFTDGSVDPDSGRSGSALTVHRDNVVVNCLEKSVRVQDGVSSTMTEVVALFEAVKVVRQTGKDAVIFSDSMSALFSLNAKNNVHHLVQEIRTLLRLLENDGISVKFVWIPSHVGIAGNERADELAGVGAQQDFIDHRFALSLHQVKRIIIAKNLEAEFEDRERLQHSRSVKYYNDVALQENVVYGMKGGNRRVESVVARLRLGYLYLWEVGVTGTVEQRECRVCGEKDGHKLIHYVMLCPRLSEYRANTGNLCMQVKHIVHLVSNILKKHKGFAPLK